MQRLVRSTAAAALVAVGLLAGCSDGDAATTVEPSDEPATSAATTPVGSPDPAGEPTLPASARGTSVRSAKSFVRYYIDLLNYAMTTGDVNGLRNVSSRCEGCDAYADLYQQRYSDGGFFRSKGWQVGNVLVTVQDKRWFALLDIHASRLRFSKHKGADIERFAPDNYSLRMELLAPPKSWSVIEIRGE